ncbi:MAG: C40 family peptidase [Gammaproteobacteria bacterium]|nr:C40 family peptidase [Gammaproteobacteria bacterium]
MRFVFWDPDITEKRVASTRQQRTIFRIAAAAIMLGLLAACASAPPPAGSKGSPGADGRADLTAARRAAAIALQQVGTPYRYGGRSPGGFDCSGLVQYAYFEAGKRLPRTTGQLWTELPPVSRNDIRVGDVLFFKVGGKMSHVGVYLGDERFVHAPSSGRKVSVATLDLPFYDAALIRAGRPQ